MTWLSRGRRCWFERRCFNQGRGANTTNAVVMMERCCWPFASQAEVSGDLDDGSFCDVVGTEAHWKGLKTELKETETVSGDDCQRGWMRTPK